MNTHYRQGDLLIQEVEKLPEALKIIPSGVILLGEVTGHSHRLEKGKLYQDKGGNMFMDIKAWGKIVHEEHSTIDLKKGMYAIVRQREYSSKDMVKVVVD